MRGMVLMLALILMASGIALTHSGAQTGAGASRAQELLAAARTALGGEAKLKAINSLSASGKFRRRINGGDLSGQLTFDLLMPDKYLKNEIMIPVPGASLTSIDIVNGEKVELEARTSGPGLIFNRPGTGNASAEAKAAAQRAVRAEYARLLLGWLLTAPASFPVEFTYAGEADALGARADVIEAKGREGFSTRLLLDQKTHRPVMLSYREKVKPSAQYRASGGESNAEIQKKIQEMMAKGETEVEIQLRFSDYRAVDGLSFPHRLAKAMDGVVSEEWEMSKFTLNPALKPEKFGKKEEPQPSGGGAGELNLLSDEQVVESVRRQFRNEPAKDFQLRSIDGRLFRLSELKGKVVMLNFWATWCSPCVWEMPLFVKLYQKYKERGFELLAVSVDNAADRDKVSAFVTEHGINFPVLYDEEVKTLYGVASFPTTFFIDRQGNVRFRLQSIIDERVPDAAINELLTHRDQTTSESADSLFKAGKFAEAEKLSAKAAAEDAKNYQAALRLGHLALLSNKFDEAQKWLTKAAELKPEEKSPKALLAEVYYRRDDFGPAAPLFAAVGREVKAKQLESFKGLAPYQIESKVEVTHLKFIHTDPLPLVQVKVNGGEEVNFLIDTGGGEVILDTEFAKKVGAVESGTERGTFGGDTKAETGEGRVNSLTLGDWVIKNVPVHILSTRPFSGAARGKPVDGIIGTVLLYHFIATLDYPNGELILRRRTKEALKQIEQQAAAEKQIVIPFWLAGDHLMVAWGRVNQSQPLLMLVDTGLAGGGFVCPPSTIAETGIKLPEGQGSEGTFGGGKARVVPFMVEALTLGEAKGQSITAFFGPFPSSLEYGQGFRIGGLISHQFFRPYALTMDFTGMKFWLKRGI